MTCSNDTFATFLPLYIQPHVCLWRYAFVFAVCIVPALPDYRGCMYTHSNTYTQEHMSALANCISVRMAVGVLHVRGGAQIGEGGPTQIRTDRGQVGKTIVISDAKVGCTGLARSSTAHEGHDDSSSEEEEGAKLGQLVGNRRGAFSAYYRNTPLTETPGEAWRRSPSFLAVSLSLPYFCYFLCMLNRYYSKKALA